MKDKKLWFKARWFGWGWYPSSWEGFAVLGTWGLWIYGMFRFVRPEQHPVWWVLGLLGSIPVLVLVCWKTGERPSWRWAGKEVSGWTVVMKVAVVIGLVFGIIGLTNWLL